MDSLPVITIRLALYADLMVLAGITAFSLYALTSEERARGLLPMVRPAVVLSVTGLLLSGFGLVALVAAMTGSDLLAVDRPVLVEIVTSTDIGTAWSIRMVALLGAVVAAIGLDRRPQIAGYGLLAASAVAVASLVWTGHAGASEGSLGTIHRVSDIVHMLAAAVWIGAIAALSAMLSKASDRRPAGSIQTIHRALQQFARIGTLAVGLIVVTGIVNCSAVVGFAHFGQLPLTVYGKLLIIKLLLFGAMLALAAYNRWRLTPTLSVAIDTDNPVKAVSALRRSLLAEIIVAMAILALVAWLGTLEPLGE